MPSIDDTLFEHFGTTEPTRAQVGRKVASLRRQLDTVGKEGAAPILRELNALEGWMDATGKQASPKLDDVAADLGVEGKKASKPKADAKAKDGARRTSHARAGKRVTRSSSKRKRSRTEKVARRAASETADTMRPIGVAENVWGWIGVVLAIVFASVLLTNSDRTSAILKGASAVVTTAIAPWDRWTGRDRKNVATTNADAQLIPISNQVPAPVTPAGAGAPGTSGRSTTAPILPILTTATQGTEI